MNFKGHLRTGIISSGLTAVAYSAIDNNPERIGLVAGACLIGSGFPDLDTDSTPSKMASFVGFIATVISIIVKEPYPMIYFAAAFFFVKSFNHRTYTHIYLLPAILFYLSYYYQTAYFAAFGIGLITHYIADSLWPWKFKNWIKFELPAMLK